MKAWPKRILRTIGVMDLVFAPFGLWMVVAGFSWREGFSLYHPDFTSSRVPYAAELYWGDVTLELFCLIFLTLTGLAVLRLQRRGLRMTNALFTFEIVRFLAEGTAFYILAGHPGGNAELVAQMIVSASTVQGTTPQIITGFPVIALIATNIAYRELPHAERWSEVRGSLG